MTPKQQACQIWLAAKTEKVGLKVTTDEPATLYSLLLETRKEAETPKYDELSRRKQEADFQATPLARAITAFKISYGLAIHSNHTFNLPIPEIHRRWDNAHEAERALLEEAQAVIRLLGKHKAAD